MRKGEKLDRSKFDGRERQTVIDLMFPQEPKELPYVMKRDMRKANPYYPDEDAWHRFVVSEKWYDAASAMPNVSYEAALGVVALQQYMLWMGYDLNIQAEVGQVEGVPDVAGVMLGHRLFFVKTAGFSLPITDFGTIPLDGLDQHAYIVFTKLHLNGSEEQCEIIGWTDSEEGVYHSRLDDWGSYWLVPYSCLHPLHEFPIHR